MTERQPEVNRDKCEQIVSLTVSYNGAGFHGFARQPGQRTVQGELESALETLFRRKIETVGAGRTDTGVHALGQVVSFSLDIDEYQQRYAKSDTLSGYQEKHFSNKGLQKLARSLNAITADDVIAREAHLRPPDFSARFSAKEREYRYRICTLLVPPLFLAPYSWWVPLDHPLDVVAMRKAAAYLLGEQDFRSFCVAKSAQDISTMRNVTGIFIFVSQHLGEHCVVVQVKGNAFLHSMVRVIVGTLLEVGLHHQEPEWISDVIAARDRRAAAQTAPANGLTLWSVRY